MSSKTSSVSSVEKSTPNREVRHATVSSGCRSAKSRTAASSAAGSPRRSSAAASSRGRTPSISVRVSSVTVTSSRSSTSVPWEMRRPASSTSQPKLTAGNRSVSEICSAGLRSQAVRVTLSANGSRSSARTSSSAEAFSTVISAASPEIFCPPSGTDQVTSSSGMASRRARIIPTSPQLSAFTLFRASNSPKRAISSRVKSPTEISSTSEDQVCPPMEIDRRMWAWVNVSSAFARSSSVMSCPLRSSSATSRGRICPRYRA